MVHIKAGMKVGQRLVLRVWKGGCSYYCDLRCECGSVRVNVPVWQVVQGKAVSCMACWRTVQRAAVASALCRVRAQRRQESEEIKAWFKNRKGKA